MGVIAAGAFCAPQSALADPAVEGAWGPLQQYPVVPVSMGVMPDGKIVAWDQANRPPNFGAVPNNGPAMILDPQTGQITRSANLAPRTTFCSLIASLPDGRLAVIGGGSDSGAGAVADVQLYDAASRTFSVLGQMNQRRWYPGGTLDRDGNPIVAGGTSLGIERFNQLTGNSTNLDTTFRNNWYPDLVRTQNGNFVIEDVGDNATAGPGRFLLSGTSLTTIADQTLLQARRRGVRTLIGPHTLFYNSGGTSRASMILDASSGTPQYRSAAQSSFPHMTGEAVTLPTGEVLVIGGNSSGNDTKGTPVMTPEIYSPSANSWTSMANIERRRTYHSVAALLPDGRVWSAGSSFEEVQEPNGQFFSPPYLFRHDGSGQLAPRPTATGAPASVAAGQTFTVDTNTPNDIAYASFIRLAATTHQVNAGQAFVQLPVTAQSGRVEMRAPSVDEAPPGYYMVFLVNEDGTPSIAPVVRMYPSVTSTPQPRVVQVSQRDVTSPAWNAFDGDASQGSGAKISRTLDESQPWWEVDFGAPRDIENVRLRLPTTCCDAGNHDVWLIASSQPIQSTDLTTARNQPGVTAVRVQTPAGQYSNLATINRNARYVRIQSTASATSLALAEVELVANQKPTVQLTAPADGASFTAPAGYTISADAADADGNVTKVEFFRGSTLVGTDDTAPFSVNDSGVGAGNYTLTAKATDNNGETTTSAPRSITVTNPGPSGPVAAYAFDEGSGGTLTDRTGRGHDGTVAGADWTTGHSGGALDFTAVGDMVSVPDHADLDLSSAFTIEAWIKPRNLQGWRMVALKEAPPNKFTYGLYASARNSAVPSAWTGKRGIYGPSPTPINTWSHLATTYGNRTLRLYVNGQLVASRSGLAASALSNGALRIGGNTIWTFETFDGLIDDVRIYNRALTGIEILADRDTPVASPAG